MTLGEVKGQLREVVHSVNNMSQKIDALAGRVAASSNIPGDLAALDVRVTALETDKHKRDGAMGFGGWLLKSPLVGWLATAAVAVWAFLQGRHT